MMNKGKILLIDNTDYIRQSVGDMLKINGYKVYLAANAEEAIKIFQSR